MIVFTTLPKVYDWVVTLMDLTSFLLSFVCWSFQVFSEIAMDEGIRSGKSLLLGMLEESQGNIQGLPTTKLGDAPEGRPTFFYRPSVILLGAIFLFITWYEFCLERRVLYESLLCLLFSLSQSSLLNTLVWESHTHIMIC